MPGGKEFCLDCGGLPNILDSFPDFKREVLEVMEGEGWILSTGELASCWIHDSDPTKMYFEEVIKDNHILRAAALLVLAAFII